MNRVTIDLTNHLQYSIHRYLELVHIAEGLTAEQMDEYLKLKEWLGPELLRTVSAAVRYSPSWPGKTAAAIAVRSDFLPAEPELARIPSTNQGPNPCE